MSEKPDIVQAKAEMFMSRDNWKAILYQDIIMPDTQDPAQFCTFYNPRNFDKSPEEKAKAAILAIQRAEKYMENFHANPLSVLPIFCDGSIFHVDKMSPSPGGYAVVIPDSRQILSAKNMQTTSMASNWRSRNPSLGFDRKTNPINWSPSAVGLPKFYESDNPEYLSVLEALSIAKYLRSTTPNYSPWSQEISTRLHVVIFSDSQNAIDLVRKGLALGSQALRKAVAQPVVAWILRIMAELKAMNVKLDVAWIPGHEHEIEAHQLADEKAREIASRAKKSKYTDHSALNMSPLLKGDPNTGVPAYVMIGTMAQDQVLTVGRRHPDTDESGRTESREVKKNADFSKAALLEQKNEHLRKLRETPEDSDDGELPSQALHRTDSGGTSYSSQSRNKETSPFPKLALGRTNSGGSNTRSSYSQSRSKDANKENVAPTAPAAPSAPPKAAVLSYSQALGQSTAKKAAAPPPARRTFAPLSKRNDNSAYKPGKFNSKQ